MYELFRGRFRIIRTLFVIFILTSFLSRIILCLFARNVADLFFLEIIKVFTVGAFFDLITFGYFMLPFIFFILLVPNVISITKVYRGIVWFFFTLTIFIMVFHGFAEYFFWDEFQVRFNFIAVDYLIYTTEVIGNILESYSVSLIIAVVAIITAIIVYIVARKKIIQQSLLSKEKFLMRLIISLKLLILPVFAIFFVTLSWSAISSNSYNNELAKNGFYSLFEAYKNSELDYNRFYATVNDSVAFFETRKYIQDSTHKYLSADVMNPVYAVKSSAAEKKMNVMFITVESLSGEYLTYLRTRMEFVTPFLDSLTHHSLFFTNFYASGTRTVRGLEALNLSIPPTPGTSIVRRPDNDHLFSLGEIFKSHGYSNKFIYGGHGYFDNMNVFFAGNGFDIVDRSVLDDKEISFENAWGACDGDMYRRAIKEADLNFNKGIPFFNYIMTTSNHRPFTFPETGMKFKNDRSGGVRYTDYALQLFFEQANNKPWFNNTIFVVVADHCGSSAGKTELPIREYQIPCFIYAPSLIKAQQIDKLCGQVDVAPTLLALLNWSYKSTFYGKDILAMSPADERAFIGTYQKLGYIKNNQLLILSPQKKTEQYTFDRKSGEVKAEQINKKLGLQIKSYYQSAEYMFKKGLNKIRENK